MAPLSTAFHVSDVEAVDTALLGTASPQKRYPPTNKGSKFPPEVLTPAEVRALLHAPSGRAPTGLRNRALIAVLYGAGLRLAEALALKVADVNLDAGDIRVLHGKGDRARTAGIDAGALVHLARWLDKRRALGVRNGALMCTLDGKPLSPRYVRTMLTRMAARAGIEKRVHPHGLRHTHAAELEREGFTVSEIQQQLGHCAQASYEADVDDHAAEHPDDDVDLLIEASDQTRLFRRAHRATLRAFVFGRRV